LFGTLVIGLETAGTLGVMGALGTPGAEIAVDGAGVVGSEGRGWFCVVTGILGWTVLVEGWGVVGVDGVGWVLRVF